MILILSQVVPDFEQDIACYTYLNLQNNFIENIGSQMGETGTEILICPQMCVFEIRNVLINDESVSLLNKFIYLVIFIKVISFSKFNKKNVITSYFKI